MQTKVIAEPWDCGGLYQVGQPSMTTVSVALQPGSQWHALLESMALVTAALCKLHCAALTS